MTDSYVLFQESRESQRHIMELERELGQQSVELESLTEDKVRLMREIAQLRAGNTRQAEENMSSSSSGYYYTSPSPTSQQSTNKNGTSTPNAGSGLVPKVSTNATISSIGALRLYEFALGIFFIAAMMNWLFV